ncbi:MAG: hypothetical protein J6J18_07080 [Oscillospiraceae bacterium]|nr:hypothetical protein [Oscillospiraceae bacterium]MBQ3192269.1 hypothetical protein [Oscillospiraceae bacterium]
MKNKRKGRSVQQLLGIQTFTKYGLLTDNGELLFYRVAPTNISVLSAANIEIKIRHLQMLLSAIPDLEIICTDSCECFDDNKAYLHRRAMAESNPEVRGLLLKDKEMLTSMQAEMSNARQFVLVKRCKGMKPEQVFVAMNRVLKSVSEQGFEAQRMDKADIKRLIAIYFGASMDGDLMPDVDGGQFFEGVDE